MVDVEVVVVASVDHRELEVGHSCVGAVGRERRGLGPDEVGSDGCVAVRDRAERGHDPM